MLRSERMNPKPKLSFEDLYNKIINKGISHRYQTKEDIIKNLSEKTIIID